MLTVWSRERGTELLNATNMVGQVDWQSGDAPPNPKGDVVLCLGKTPHEFFTEQSILPKNRTITSLRGLAYPVNLWGKEVKLMFSYSTGIGSVDYGKFVDLQLDLGTALRLEQTGSISPKLGNYRYVPNFSEVVQDLKNRIANGEDRIDIALDLETLGLDPYAVAHSIKKGAKVTEVPAAYIITIQLTTRAGESDVVRFENKDEMKYWISKHRAELDFILNCPNLVMSGANLKFDLHWIKVHFDMYCANFKFDTNLVGSCLDENRSNALDVHTKIYTPELGGYSDIFDKTVDKGRMDLVDKDFLLGYAGGDTDATWRIKQVMKKELLKQPRLASFYVNILHPASRAFEKVEQHGVYVDQDRFAELEIEVQNEMSRLTDEARKLIGGRIWAKHKDDTKRDGINLTKAGLIIDYMFSPMGLNLRPKMKTGKKGDPSTAMEHLNQFADHPEAKEFVALLGEYGSAAKTMSTYLTGFRQHLRSDGRFHPSYFLFAGNRDAGDGGTVTGRLSAKDPAFQTIPKHTDWGKKIRSCYTAPEGYVVGEFDYSQGELRVVACVANEENMIQAYLEGKDLHTLTASNLLNKTYEEMLALKKSDKDLFDVYRQYGKPCNFGLLYGMSAAGLVEYARINYGVHFTLEQAEEFRHQFLYKAYPMLPEYHKYYKALAKRNGQVESPLGRIRHLPLINSRLQDIRSGAERQAVNSPIQGCLSDMLCWAMAISNETGLVNIAPDFGAIHDATYKYIPEDRVDEVVERQLEIMENLPFHKVGWNPQLKFIADAKVGNSMGELKEWSKAA